ncbi:hypothetical protein AB1Y20_000808 [Prymnesium parvum]|uniref:Actin-related protein 2/3 complex subunit 3 n=1 Tax=Prymnesium parvum TaxID=97485 RepID=A0AB34K5U4_PRYPA
MVYHSTMNDRPDVTVVCGCGILPLKTTCRGPAPPCPEGEDDIVDEVLNYFKANVLFKQFEVKGSADRVLIYLTLYVTQCLSKLTTCQSKADGVHMCRSYLKQLREEIGRRIISKVYSQDDGAPSKFWLVFSKRKFMNKSLV